MPEAQSDNPSNYQEKNKVCTNLYCLIIMMDFNRLNNEITCDAF